MNDWTALSQICMAPGISGDEETAAAVAKKLFEPYCDQVDVDPFYNVIARKTGRHRQPLHIMLASHLDEIGFVVSEITESGFLKIKNVGGIDTKILPAHEVIVYGKKPLPGIVGMKPLKDLTPHEKTNAALIDEILVDVGYSRAEVEQNVKIGDRVALKSELLELNGKYVSVKTLDNRICVNIMLQVAKEMERHDFNHNVSFVSTSREETGAHGAIVAAHNLKPDLSIVFDVGQAKTPDSPHFGLMNLGKGPYVTIGPQLNEALSRKLIAICREHGIPSQIAVSGGWTGTDASAIHVVDRGIPCILVGIPLKYMHTSIETVHIGDFQHAVAMIVRFLEFIDRLEGEEFHAIAAVM